MASPLSNADMTHRTQQRDSASKRKSNGESHDSQAGKRVRLSYAETVDLLVGSEKHKFSVHKDHLCSSSDFFKAACSLRWRGNRQDPIEVPLVEPRVFETYLHFLYTDELVPDVVTPLDDQALGPYGLKKRLGIELGILYVAGDMLMDDRFKRTTIDETLRRIDSSEVSFSHRAILRVWPDTPPNSGMRRLLVDYRAAVGSRIRFYEHHGIPKSFLTQLSFVQGTMLRRVAKDPGIIKKTKPTFEKRKKYYDGAEKEVDDHYRVLDLDEDE